jgi:hypothetical protein
MQYRRSHMRAHARRPSELVSSLRSHGLVVVDCRRSFSRNERRFGMRSATLRHNNSRS